METDKELNQLLPSNILDEVDVEDKGFEEEEEIVDDLAYHLKSGSQPIKNHQPIRFYSDSTVFLSSMTKKEPPAFTMQSQQSQMMNYAMMQSMYSMSNAMFAANMSTCLNPYVNNQMYNGMGMNCPKIQLERKRTDPLLFLNSLPKKLLSNPMNSPNDNSFISFNSRKKTNSSSNFNAAKTKASTRSPKESFDSTSLPFSRRLSDINVEQYEIDDFINYIDSLHCEVQEFICSQKGSKDMMKYLNKSPGECRTILLNTLKKGMVRVMMDKCGNYFSQQLIQLCKPMQLMLLMSYIKGDIVKIAKNYSGTHALQALIDVLTSREEEAFIIEAIQGAEVEMMYDSNATHVLQKLLICISEENRNSVNAVIIAHIVPLCYDSNGICVAKKLIKTTSSQTNKACIIEAITTDCLEIAQNPYGNYCIQCIFEEWSALDYPEMIKVLIDNIEALSIQKFSSNVVEKLIEYIDEPRKSELFSKMFNSSAVLRILKMRYGKYVLQKAIKCMSAKQKKEIKKALIQVVASIPKETSKLEGFISHFDG